MARTTDSARLDGGAVVVNNCWDGYPLTAHPCPLDIGIIMCVVDFVLFTSGISPVTGTGATKTFPPTGEAD